MIIIDEAHKLKIINTNLRVCTRLKEKFCLLLTATPIQNDIFELYYLISLLKPGHLGNYDTFQSAFSASKHDLEHDDYLKELVNQVMVRNRRKIRGLIGQIVVYKLYRLHLRTKKEKFTKCLATFKTQGHFH